MEGKEVALKDVPLDKEVAIDGEEPEKTFGDKACKEIKTRYSPFRLIPILGWIRHYTLNDVFSDIVAGLTIGLMMTPQGMVRIYATFSKNFVLKN